MSLLRMALKKAAAAVVRERRKDSLLLRWLSVVFLMSSLAAISRGGPARG